MKVSNNSIELHDNKGSLFTLCFTVEQDLGKNEIIIFNHKNRTQKSFKKIKHATKYLMKKSISKSDLKRIVELNNKYMRSRSSEKRSFSTPGLGLEYSKEINKK